MSAPSVTPRLTFADVWQGAAQQVGADGEALAAFLNRLDGRAYGAAALILGVVLLIPVHWILPQAAGLLLIIAGWRLFGDAQAPFVPFSGRRIISKQRFEAAGAFIQRQSWLNAITSPRLSGLTLGFASHAAAIAFILGGFAALIPCTHYVLVLGLALLGLGIMQRDGAATLAGLAATFAASAFTLTLVAGAVAGAPFAAAWSKENLPLFIAQHQPAP